MSETSLRRSVILQAPATPVAPEVQAIEHSPIDQSHSIRPTESQVRTKSRFWSKWAEQPLLHGKEPTLEQIQKLTGSSSIQNWWVKPGFKEWFLNANSNTDRLEWLVHLALNSAQDILLSEDARSSTARAQMIKLVLDLATKTQTSVSQGTSSAPGQAPAKVTPMKVLESLSKEELQSIVDNANKSTGE
jgi:hypothetical protein